VTKPAEIFCGNRFYDETVSKKLDLCRLVTKKTDFFCSNRFFLRKKLKKFQFASFRGKKEQSVSDFTRFLTI
jgi:hypothetical protein